MDMGKPPAWFHWSLLMVNLAALFGYHIRIHPCQCLFFLDNICAPPFRTGCKHLGRGSNKSVRGQMKGAGCGKLCSRLQTLRSFKWWVHIKRCLRKWCSSWKKVGTFLAVTPSCYLAARIAQSWVSCFLFKRYLPSGGHFLFFGTSGCWRWGGASFCLCQDFATRHFKCLHLYRYTRQTRHASDPPHDNKRADRPGRGWNLNLKLECS